MQKYTLGFIFDSSREQVLLMHKLKPEWQAGKINGVGGKMEEGEEKITCIVREVREETGLETERDSWIYVGEIGSDAWQTHVFALVYQGNSSDVRSMEKERVEWFAVDALPANIISNLTWLVPLAIDRIKSNEFSCISVRYN